MTLTFSLRSSLAGAVLLGASWLAPACALAAPDIIYVTRHAEKVAGAEKNAGPDKMSASDKDPDLSAQGQARARHLAAILRTTGIGQIYSTATKRARQTAQPLATDLGLEMQTYDPAQPAKLVEKVKGASGTVLLVGHSNTVPELVKLLGGKPGPDIGEFEYDRLYQLIFDKDGAVTTVLFHSVAP